MYGYCKNAFLKTVSAFANYKESLDLTDDERLVYDVLSKTMAKLISDIMASSNIQFGKSKVSELLKSMEKKGVVSIEGNGRGTKYRISVGPRKRTVPNETGMIMNDDYYYARLYIIE